MSSIMKGGLIVCHRYPKVKQIYVVALKQLIIRI